MKKQLLSLLFTVYLPVTVTAQHLTDSVQHLPEVKVQADKALGNRSLPQHAMDTLPFLRLIQSTAAMIVNDVGSAYLRNYGPGNIATLSVNGTGPAQTTVEWNDLPLNNPSHGMTDLSIQPSFLIDRVSLTEGAAGNSGAVVHLQSAVPFDTGSCLTQFFSLGSFGRFENGTGFRSYNGIVSTQTRVYHMEADNNFPLKDADGRERIQRHATQQQLGFAQDFAIRAGKGMFEAHVLAQRGDRQIPPLMLNTNSSKEQWDESYRFSADYLQVNSHASHKFSVGAMSESIRYRDTLIHLDDTSRSTSVMAGYLSRIRITGQFFAHVQIRSLLNRVEVPEYTNVNDRLQTDATFGIKWVNEKLEVSADVNGMSAGAGLNRIYPSFGMYFACTKNITFRANASGTYRIPTFNDLYWQPGGNQSLEPEKGMVSNGAIAFQFNTGVFKWKAEQGLYYTHTNNAIVWVPDNNGVYTAHNIHEIRTDGYQGLFAVTVAIQDLQLSLAANVQYTEAVIVKSTSEFRSAIGKQMVYVPDWAVRPVLTATYANWMFRFAEQNNGTRFTVADHSARLDPYSVTDVVLTKTMHVKNCQVTAGVQVNNVFAADYQCIAWQAMPRRSFGFSLLMELH